jgi:hypothetical protein
MGKDEKYQNIVEELHKRDKTIQSLKDSMYQCENKYVSVMTTRFKLEGECVFENARHIKLRGQDGNIMFIEKQFIVSLKILGEGLDGNDEGGQNENYY